MNQNLNSGHVCCSVQLGVATHHNKKEKDKNKNKMNKDEKERKGSKENGLPRLPMQIS